VDELGQVGSIVTGQSIRHNTHCRSTKEFDIVEKKETTDRVGLGRNAEAKTSQDG